MPSRAALFSNCPVSSAAPNAPSPNVASTSSEVDPTIAISASCTSTEPLAAMAVTKPRLMRSMITGARPTLITWPPRPQMIGLPACLARRIRFDELTQALHGEDIWQTFEKVGERCGFVDRTGEIIQ